MPGDLTPHDQAMVDKVDQAAAQLAATQPTQIGAAPEAASEPAKPQRPDDVPEKFWDAEKGTVRTEELLKSYRELEAVKPGSDPAKPADQAKPDEAAAAVEAAELDMDALQSEYASTGNLSEESFAALEKAGYSRQQVSTYLAGVQAQTEASFALVGGKDEYGAMLQWAGQNLNPTEVSAFNAAVGDPASSKTAIMGLKARMDAAIGSEPKLLGGQTSTVPGAEQPFASRAEVTAAMRDPRYKADPAYRAQVERRVGAMVNF